MKKCQRTFCMKVTWTDFSLIFKNVKVKRQEASCCFRNRLWLSLVHICRNARGTLVYVHLVLHGMLLFCFIQEADLWPKPSVIDVIGKCKTCIKQINFYSLFKAKWRNWSFKAGAAFALTVLIVMKSLMSIFSSDFKWDTSLASKRF